MMPDNMLSWPLLFRVSDSAELEYNNSKKKNKTPNDVFRKKFQKKRNGKVKYTTQK
jgi:hypothetical protein